VSDEDAAWAVEVAFMCAAEVGDVGAVRNGDCVEAWVERGS
jgi:hypothetical protein